MTEQVSNEGPQQSYRSTASNNWRVRDDAPRVGPPQSQQRFPRQQNQNSGSYGGGSPAGSDTQSSGTRLYVGNLLYSAQKADIEALFVENGFVVTGINISTDPFTGRNPSYCFVDLDTPEEAQRAMSELNGKDVLGRPVKINPGVAKRAFGSGGNVAAGGSPQPRVKSYDRGWGRDGTAPQDAGNNENYKPTFDRWNRNDASSHWNNPAEQGKRVYVGGLPRIEPQSAVDAEMQKLFEGFELQAVSKIISPHASKANEPGNHYYLFVDLPSAEAVDAVIESLNGAESPWGGELKISRAKDNRDRKVNREQNAGGYSRPSGGGSGRWGNDARQE